jgi:hypothetical protein
MRMLGIGKPDMQVDLPISFGRILSQSSGIPSGLKRMQHSDYGSANSCISGPPILGNLLRNVLVGLWGVISDDQGSKSRDTRICN